MHKSIISTTVICLSLFSSFAYGCTLADARVCVINEQLTKYGEGHTVAYKADAHGALAEYEWVVGAPDNIHVGETRELDDNELLFVIAHEYGHSLKRHGRKVLEAVAGPEFASLNDFDLLTQHGSKALDSSNIPTALNHQQEFEADAFACQFMLAQNMDCVKAMKTFLRSTSPSREHPAKISRISKVKTLLSLK